ncbi:hypothetical protein BY996DRAFT_6413677 [Phakopsora pachyrhizi]|nr:hypothetical protein BY996DRAFT_6413677 [Phakopsora pachyrhizi]
MPLVDQRRRRTGSASKSITTGQGGGGVGKGGWPPEERRPETADPQPRADDLEGDEELGGGVPQGWGICDIAGPTGQEAGFNTRNAASGAAIAQRVSKNRHCKGMFKDCGKKYCRADNVKGCTVTWDRYCRTDDARGPGGDVRIDNRRADKGKNALWRTIVCSTDKEAVGMEEAGGRPE